MAEDAPRTLDEHQPDKPAEPKSAGIPAAVAPSAYQTTLMRIIESTIDDPAKVRRLVYELARMNLKREAWQSSPRYSAQEVRECLHALETAIGRVEADLSREQTPGLAFPQLTSDPGRLIDDMSPGPLPEIPPPAAKESAPASESITTNRVADAKVSKLEVEHAAHHADDPDGPELPVWMNRAAAGKASAGVPVPVPQRQRWSPSPEPAIMPRPEQPAARTARPQVEIVYPERENAEVTRLRRRAWLWFIMWPLILVTVPVTISVIFYVALSGRVTHQDQVSQQIATEQTRAASAAQESAGPSSGLPLPTTYGVYAISNGQLSELQPLPIKAPDPRIMLSAEITKPSATTLPDGNVVFVVFRRELVNSAPQKVSVRVVARVSRSMSFEAGKPTTADVQDSWRIRSNSFDYTVSPLNESREMIAIRPEMPELVLAAGRYALIFEGLAYDFTVDGPVTDRAQCLESVAAVNGPIYSECRPK